MRKSFPRRKFNHAANPVPDMAHVSPATLINCGLGAPVDYDFSGANLPDKFDFVGAQNYSRRIANLVGNMIMERNKQQLQKEPDPKPEPEPELKQ